LEEIKMPRKSWSAVGLVVTVAILVGAAWADRPNASSEELQQASTAIVTGKVKCIYSSTERKENWETTKFVVEVTVARCEKGDVKPGGLVYARYYSRRALGKGLTAPGYYGIHTQPRVGQSVRLYLTTSSSESLDDESDGGFNIVGPNGCELLKPDR
jgi:hypothetical protein